MANKQRNQTNNLTSEQPTQTGLPCRLCTKSIFKTVPIFTGKGADMELESKITKHLHLDVSLNDKLPHQICLFCANILSSWEKFYENCLISEKAYKEILLSETEIETNIEVPKHMKVLMEKKLKSPTIVKTNSDVGTQRLQSHMENGNVQNKILVVQPESVISNKVLNGSMPKINRLTSVKSGSNNVMAQNLTISKRTDNQRTDNKRTDNTSNNNKRTDNQNAVIPIECIELSDVDDDDVCVKSKESKEFPNTTAESNIAALKKVRIPKSRENLNKNATQNATVTSNKIRSEKETLCTICCTLFPNYLQYAAHRMAAHRDETETVTSSESEESESETSSSSTDSEQRNMRSRKKNMHSRKKNMRSRKKNKPDSNDESHTWWDEDGNPKEGELLKCSNPKESELLKCSNPKEGELFKCSQCSTEFPSYISLAAHGMAAHKNVYYNSNAPKVSTINQNVSKLDNKEYFIDKQDSVSVHYKEESIVFDDKQFVSLFEKEHNNLHSKEVEIDAPIYLNGNEASPVHDKKEQMKDCPVCHKDFKKSDFKAHLKSSHPDICHICYKAVSPDSEEYQNHILSHSNDYLCEICGMSLSSSFSLKIHVTRRHPEKLLSQKCKKVTCRRCLARFRTRNELRRHRIRKHYALKNCPFCGKVYNESYLKQHLKITHSFTQPFSCELCEQAFKSKDILHMHLKYHSPSTVTVHNAYESKRCEKCGKCFTSLKIMKRHLKTICYSNSAICDTCGLVLETPQLLRQHRLKHRDLKPYKCKFCDKGFKLTQSRDAHECKHTGEKPFICEVCGKGYRGRNNLYKHSELHNDTHTYTCDYCEKSYQSKGNLRIHLLSHNKYECPMCSRTIFRYANYKKHLKTHRKQGETL